MRAKINRRGEKWVFKKMAKKESAPRIWMADKNGFLVF